MIPDSDGRTVGRTVRQTESIMARTALCIASYADALSKISIESQIITVFSWSVLSKTGWRQSVSPQQSTYDVQHKT